MAFLYIGTYRKYSTEVKLIGRSQRIVKVVGKLKKCTLKKPLKIDPSKFCLNLHNFYIILQQKTFLLKYFQVDYRFLFSYFIGEKRTKFFR
jgi:hypothetical protein